MLEFISRYEVDTVLHNTKSDYQNYEKLRIYLILYSPILDTIDLPWNMNMDKNNKSPCIYLHYTSFIL